MKKVLYMFFALILCNVAGAQGVFDSMDTATEIKLAPTVKAATGNLTTPAPAPKAQETVIPVVKQTETTQTTQTTVKNPYRNTSIKEQKFNSALTNLDDAQVELRQELSVVNARYSEALGEKERILVNCKNLKKEIKEINAKMKNVEKSKKIINKNLDVAQ